MEPNQNRSHTLREFLVADLKRSANYLWRLTATFLSFAIFCIGALILSYIIMPFIYAHDRDPELRSKRCQMAIHKGFRFVFWYMEKFRLTRLNLENLERLKNGPYLILANHPSFLDVVLMLAQIPAVDCVVKSSHWRNIFIKKIVVGANYISNDATQDPNAFMDICVDRLKRGRSVIIFPEGTRSPLGKLLKFHRGPALIAIRSGVPILPVILSCEPATLMKGQMWYQIPEKSFVLGMRVCEPLSVKPIIAGCQNDWISGRKLTTYLQDFFAHEVPGLQANSVPFNDEEIDEIGAMADKPNDDMPDDLNRRLNKTY